MKRYYIEGLSNDQLRVKVVIPNIAFDQIYYVKYNPVKTTYVLTGDPLGAVHFTSRGDALQCISTIRYHSEVDVVWCEEIN